MRPCVLHCFRRELCLWTCFKVIVFRTPREFEIGPNVDSLIEGAVGYIDMYVIPYYNIFRTPTFIETLEDKLKNLVLSTRFNS